MNASSRKCHRPYTNFWSLNKLFLAVTNPTYFTIYNLLLDFIFVFLVPERTNLMLREVAVASVSVNAYAVRMQPECVQTCLATSLLVRPGVVDSISWHLGSCVAHTELHALQPLRQSA